MKEEFASQLCSVCSARADGLHYGAVSCRSCNAFFRRTVVEKAEYRCKLSQQCVINPEGRCACRYCRFQKCLSAGMKISAVQPRRDPTGSQKDRRKRSLNSSASGSVTPVMSPSAPQPPIPELSQEAELSFGSPIPTATQTTTVHPSPIKSHKPDTPLEVSTSVVKMEEEDVEYDTQIPSSSNQNNDRHSVVSCSPSCSKPTGPPFDEKEHHKFTLLVHSYRDHIRMMQLNHSTIESFLAELSKGPKLREMLATDVEKLSTVELSGLLFWTEKMEPFGDLSDEDKGNLLKRYSVRKLSLDHFYNAAIHVDQAQKGNFVMNNYTYVPPHRTGFELPSDDEKQIHAKRETFAATYDRFWKNVILPFMEMKVVDAEIVYLQVMLMWSQTNNEHISATARVISRERRDWAMRRLFEWYRKEEREEQGIRFGQITLLLGEIEIICDMHCQDFQVAKLFEFCDMSQFWYENLCYTPINTTKMQYDPHIIENLKKFTAMSFIEKADVREIRVCSSPAPPMNDFNRPTLQMMVAAGVSSDSKENRSEIAPSGILTPSPEETQFHLQSPHNASSLRNFQ